MANIVRQDLEGRRIVLLGSMEKVSLDVAAIGAVTTLFQTGDIVNPAGEPSVVVAFVTLEWPASQGQIEPGNQAQIQQGGWQAFVDLHSLLAGGGALVPYLQCPAYGRGIPFTFQYSAGPGSAITPTISAFGWAA